MSVSAKELALATSLSIPPYILKDSNSGIQLEIVKEALKVKGYEIREMVYASNKRVQKMFEQNKVDGIINLASNLPNVFYSDTIIEYENVAIALKKHNFKINNIDDLKDKNVLAFQNANKFLTADFSAMAKKNRRYKEVINQIAQVHNLYKERTEVIVMGKRIFLYFRNQAKLKQSKTIGLSNPITIYKIFPPTPRRMGFHTQQLRDEFNNGLKQIKISGKYQNLVDKYLK